MDNESKVAIVVNGTARAVDKNVLSYLETVADELKIKLFVSRSLSEAEHLAKKIINDGFDVVMCGGGDGTFKQCMTNIMKLQPEKPPAFGVLSLGTGNSIATALGAHPIIISAFGNSGAEEELAQAKDLGARAIKKMLVINGIYTPFAGIGLDSWVLSDYEKVKRFFDKIPIMPKRWRGKWDYFWAIVLFSSWRFMRNPLPEVIIKNTEGIAYQINQEGDKIYNAIPAGEVLYKGKISLVAASSIRYYGWGIRLFPQANTMSDYFQLRISAMGFGETVRNLPALFSGELFGQNVFDFACQNISIEISDKSANPPSKHYAKRYRKKYSDGIPFQIGGDPAGKRKIINIKSEDVEVVIGAKKPPKSPT
ncbi:MAG: diacylglycerol kinase family protein [Patescibacteria group bacterium]